MFHARGISLLKTMFQTWPGLSVYSTPPQMLFGEFAPLVPSTHFLPSQSTSVSIIGRKLWQGRLLSQRGERRLNMVWLGMWENSRVHLYIHQPACQPSSRPSRPLRAWTRGAFVPHLQATPCPAPAPHLTLLSILLDLLCLPLFTRGPSSQNSTAGPLWK